MQWKTSWKNFSLLVLMLCSCFFLFAQQIPDSTSSIEVASQEIVDTTIQSLDYIDVVPPLLEERKVGAYPWVFIVAIAVLLLVGLIRTIAFPQHKLSLLMAFSNISNQYEQIDKEATINPIIVLQAFVSAVILTMGIFVMEPFPIPLAIPHNFTFFLVLLLGVCLVYIFKYFMHYLVGTILQSEDLAKLMVVGLSGMMYAFTLLVFPLVVCWYYVPEESIKNILAIGIMTAGAVFVVWRLIKSLLIYYRYFPFAKIYIIIYLCALEITPLLIIGKMIAMGVTE